MLQFISGMQILKHASTQISYLKVLKNNYDNTIDVQIKNVLIAPYCKLYIRAVHSSLENYQKKPVVADTPEKCIQGDSNVHPKNLQTLL